MLVRSLCRFALLTCLLISWPILAAVYEIDVKEGAHKFDPNSKPSDKDNKYLASVTVKKDGKVVASDIRASTLPDAWMFYVRWNVELKRTSPPKDAEIIAMFDHFEEQTKRYRESGTKLGNTPLADIADIMDVLNRIPAIPSGEYRFVTGLHRNNSGPHGRPYAVRLLGGAEERPFDPAVPKSEATVVGGFIRTLNKNNAQGQRKMANGINVHDGRPSRDYKDSEGCLTIHPDHWSKFIKSLPSPEEWARDKHTGKLILTR
ncbi:hypothetical protein [Devosia sp.]|uniref:hypothetical protein n=1 Tax=Devosia sp. TaxID=1871048 RepID=UPI0037C061DF